MSSFSGKTAVVTGGCSGIGYAIVKNFVERGMTNVAILDLNDSKNVTESLQNSYRNQKIIFIKTDVTKKDQIRSAFSEIVSQFEFINFVVGCAGIFNEKNYEQTINVNVLGLLHTTYTAIDFLDKANGGQGGSIVSIASVAGLDDSPNFPAYGASKHAVVGLNKCFSDEFYFNKYGIKFITICPNYTDTPMLCDWENRLEDEILRAALKDRETAIIQTADSVGQCICEILNLGKNGSVWIISDGKMNEVTLKKYFLTS